MSRVILAMSGGVDSSVSAELLRRAGHEVIGVFMRHGMNQEPELSEPDVFSEEVCTKGTCATVSQTVSQDMFSEISSPCVHLPMRDTGFKGSCCSVSDSYDARRVADKLNIPFHVVDFSQEFTQIVEHFVSEYTRCRTPNPCVECNTRLKFNRLFHYADTLGAEYVATGHYAQLEKDSDGQIQLLCGRDPGKDQSYVLFGIRREMLGRLLFPVGGFLKREIRAIAEEIGLKVAQKRDSQEICFIPDNNHARFVQMWRRQHDGMEETTSGEIITSDGNVVGIHSGVEHFTVGQRKGLGLAFGSARYVIRLDPETRQVVIGTHEELARKSLTASGGTWLISPPTEPLECAVKIRYRSPAEPAVVIPVHDNAEEFRVEFHQAVYGVAPGQCAVCYHGKRLLGGGFIN